MASTVVSYELDDATTVQFEMEPSQGFQPAGADEIGGRIREAVAPAVESARIVLEKARSIGPNEVTVKFGIKVSGTTDWFVAKAAAEGNFEITMVWKPTASTAPADGVTSIHDRETFSPSSTVR